MTKQIATSSSTRASFLLPGYWRVLDFDYEMKLLGHVTQLVDSESWAFSRVPLQTSLDELAPLEPRSVILIFTSRDQQIVT